MEKKKKENYTYEFQEFIAINQIKRKKLPKFLRKMMKQIDSLEAKAKSECTSSHYRLVVKQLKPFANMVMDELHEIYGDQIKNNNYQQQDSETKEVNDPIEVKLLQYYERYDTYAIDSLSLKSIGVSMELIYSQRTIEIGRLLLRRQLGTDLWFRVKKEGGKDE